MSIVIVLKIWLKNATMETRSVMISKNNVLQYKKLYKTLYYFRRNQEGLDFLHETQRHTQI